METVLVTGGAGFIGSHLVERLVAEGFAVRVLDDLSSGRPANLAGVRGRIDFREGDIRDPAALRPAVSGCSRVFHLAAVVSVQQTIRDPAGSAAVNETGALQVLEAAREAGVRRLVFASSSAVYGDDPRLPLREDLPPRPRSPYAVQKLAVEHYLAVYRDLFGLSTASLRFFNVFGPRQDPSSPYSGVISIFFTRALAGEAPVIYGDGLQTRDFVYVADVVEALLLAARSRDCGVFNVGTGREVDILSLWRHIAALTGCPRAPQHLPPRPGDIRRSVAAVGEAASRLNFSARIRFEEGLARTLAWYRRRSNEA
ncbi:MAG: SDR family oxidoreductase [Desulfobacterales bacterium]